MLHLRLSLALALASTGAFGADATAPAATAAPTASAVPAPPSLSPAMSGPHTANAAPLSYDTGPLGKWYVTGVVSGLVQTQDNIYNYHFASAPDGYSRADLSNAQVFINKPDGVIQFFAQLGSYTLPDLGVPYVQTGDSPNTWYGTLSQVYIKLAPNDHFSIQAGKLPTLVGAEYTFSFENMNIERGLLWNQENGVNRGVQVNYTAGPLALSASWNDGLLSSKYSWAWLSATYTVDKMNTLAFIAGGNTQRTTVSTAVTPPFQNNEQIYNVIWTHTTGPWVVQPYLQYTSVPTLPALGSTQKASTFGAAVLVNYAVPSVTGLNLPVRVEYISSTGSVANGAPNLLYGPGSKAWSVTFTPTYQYKIFFARAELSLLQASGTTAGAAFGATGNQSSQLRALLELGMLF